jgi:hypothetical protein
VKQNSQPISSSCDFCKASLVVALVLLLLLPGSVSISTVAAQ